MRQLPIIFLSIILSYYSNVLSLSKDKKENILALTGLKAFIKNVENTENQIASCKQKADIHYKKMEPYTAADVICILLKR